MASTSIPPGGGFLGLVERVGNKLPEPVFLFLGATLLIMALSAVGSMLNWQVQPLRPQVVTEVETDHDGRRITRQVLNNQGRPVIELIPVGEPVRPRSLLDGQGIYWLISNLVRNFLNFPPLGVVVVSMFGIGVAEKVGLFGAAMKWVAGLVPSRLLTPTVVLLGVLSNIASDAGYIVLPPLAAGLYMVFGRPPLAGIAAAFAGIGGGFSANLLFGSTDVLVSGITEAGARTLDPSYSVLPTCNWYFMAASTVLIMFLAWAVTSWIVEPRLLATRHLDIPIPSLSAGSTISPIEARGLRWAGIGLAAALALVAALLLIPGAPLAGTMPAPTPTNGPIPQRLSPAPGAVTPAPHAQPQGTPQGSVAIPPGFVVEAYGTDASGEPIRGRFVFADPLEGQGRLEALPEPAPRWSVAIVPIIVIVFLTPGIAYGIATREIRSQKDLARAFIHSMQIMAPVITMAFFAAQFIECFRYSRLDRMLAFVGGDMLAASGLAPVPLLLGVVAVTMVVNILMSSMSAKWTMLAPILAPMMMMVGISPELTQCAYRVGDSITNIVTPLNTYAIVILAVMQRYRSESGMGQLIATMLPYSIAYALFWPMLLVGYVWAGLPLGPSAPTWYAPAP
ncbi:MAG: AbgT family transporter [Phycisphaerae bacterium]|nr:AbgT family transporter [Phycisphaerae bacterium]